MSAALAEVFPVGEILSDELVSRGWTQADFAEILDRPAQFVSEIISGKKEVTRESATQIAAALGTSPELWLNLQNAYHLWRHAQDRGKQESLIDVRLRARLKELAPIGVLKQRGILTGSTPREQEAELKRLYRIDDIFDDPEVLVAARRSKDDQIVSSTQLAWVVCVRQKAETLKVGPYNQRRLKILAAQLTRIVDGPAAINDLPARFAEVGVRLVFVEAFPSSKMDGCSFLLDNGSPVIGLSGRGQRLDKVLFTLLHEVAHVLLDHLDGHRYIIDDKGESPTLGSEDDADALAASWVFPQALPKVPQRLGFDWVTVVASQQGIHPIVVIGHLQNQGKIPWKTVLVRNAPAVTAQLQKW